MINFDYTKRGRRPSAAEIVAEWKREGMPIRFTVTYGETFAEFEYWAPGRWQDSGNGCRGVDRTKVVAALTEVTGQINSLEF